MTKHPIVGKDQNCTPPTIDYEDVRRCTMKKIGKKMKVIFCADYK
jgi:hypothetical protein